MSNGRDFDTSRLFQHNHDTQQFQEIMEMLEKYPDEEDNMPEKNVVISSDSEPIKIYSDYFAHAKFSRG